jgi:hypothetical protein
VKPNPRSKLWYPTPNWMERMLSYWCPTTRQVVQTSIETTDGELYRLRSLQFSVWCPYCQAGHCIPANQAFIAGAPATAP